MSHQHRQNGVLVLMAIQSRDANESGSFRAILLMTRRLAASIPLARYCMLALMYRHDICHMDPRLRVCAGQPPHAGSRRAE